MDVLYSLLDNNNGRLNILAQEEVFSNILKFVSIDDTNFIDRFCTDILPKIHRNVKCLIFDSVFMERILLTTKYPNLTDLEILHFQKELASNYFTNESPLRSIFEEQIINLTLVNDDDHQTIDSLKDYTTNVYGNILNLFKNLKHLSIIGSPFILYPGLSLCDLPSSTCFSSILIHLHIHVNTFNDCLYLLDGRLKQLSTLSVIVYNIDSSLQIVHNTDNLPNLKCFSLKSTTRFRQYDKVLLLLRRMSNVEQLTLYLSVGPRTEVIDGIDVQNDILYYMPQLQSFTFYICALVYRRHLPLTVSDEDIGKTLININKGHATSMVNRVIDNAGYCSIFSLPFVFDCVLQLSNKFPNIIFKYVKVLSIQDTKPFEHEFFIRIARSFPLLQHLSILNYELQCSYTEFDIVSFGNRRSYSIIEYPHLEILDLRPAHANYIEQFLMEKKAYVPSLMELMVDTFQLEVATDLFRREDTRGNCAKIKRLIITRPIKHTNNFSLYFPSLEM